VIYVSADSSFTITSRAVAQHCGNVSWYLFQQDKPMFDPKITQNPKLTALKCGTVHDAMLAH